MTAPERSPEESTVRPRRPLLLVVCGIASALLLGACWVQIVALESATVEVPTRRYGRGQTEVGLWALYIPFAFALLATCYAMKKLPPNALSECSGRR